MTRANKRIQDWLRMPGEYAGDGTATDMGSIADSEVPSRSSYTECTQELPIGIVQCACNDQNWLGRKRRRQQGGNGNRDKAMHPEMLIYLVRPVLPDSSFERFLFPFSRKAIGNITASNSTESSYQSVIGPVFRMLRHQNDKKYVDTAWHRDN